PVHLLPILMTVVNLITAWFYTRNGNTGERKQMLVVAAIFLVLLFNLPSGLVLYWTMNNVFSFFRLFVTNPEVFKKSSEKRGFKSKYKEQLQFLWPKLKTTFYLLTVVLILGQLNWAFQHSFDGIALRLSAAVLAGFVLTLLLGLFVLLHPVKSDWANKTAKEWVLNLWSRFGLVFTILLVLAVFSQINWALAHNFNNIVLRLFLAVSGSALLTALMALIVILYQNKLKISGGSFIWKFQELRTAYKWVLYILILLAVASQINWAVQFSFDDIIIRIIVAILASWILILLIANGVNKLKKNIDFSAQNLRTQLHVVWQKTKWFYIILTLLALGSQINWALQFNFDDIWLRLILALTGSVAISGLLIVFFLIKPIVESALFKITISKRIYFSFLFLAVYFYLSSVFYINGTNNTLSLISLFFIISLQLTGIVYFNRANKNPSPYFYRMIRYLFGFFITIQLLNAYVFIFGTQISLTLFKSTLLIKDSSADAIALIGLLIVFIALPFYLRESRFSWPKNPSWNNWMLIILLVIYLFGHHFLWNPLTVYGTSPTSFSFTALDIIKENISLFFGASLFLVVLYALLSVRGRNLMIIVMLLAVALTFFNSSIFPIDMGTLQSHRFSNLNNLAAPVTWYIFEALFLIALFKMILTLLKKSKIRYVNISLIILIIISFSQSILIPVKEKKSGVVEEKLSFHSKHAIPFSKDKPNVLFIVADMVQGWYLDKILEELPDLVPAFDGFTYYPNTLAISNYTTASSPSIMGGYRFTPDKINADTSKTVAQKIILAQEFLRDKVKLKGYEFICSDIPYSGINKNTLDSYIPLWHSEWDYLKHDLNIGSSRELNYSLLWQNALFFSTPLFIKPKIYNYGEWLFKEKQTNENTELTKHYNFTRILRHISNTQASNSTFAFIWSNASHFPWDMIDDKGNFIQNVSPFENNKWMLKELALWFQWMQENGVYDNTKIVLLSDHGIRDTEPDSSVMIINPFENGLDEKVPLKELLNFTPLLMVKDFNAKGTLQKDFRIMSNVDGIYIALDENDPTRIEPPLERTLEAFLVSWRIHVNKKALPILKKYEVKQNVYKKENWNLIESNEQYK
ncbi:MAG: hypothetical protein CVU09_14675, partial [Bacteroidetes bacterium HGW-Bacteroidetes-4]